MTTQASDEDMRAQFRANDISLSKLAQSNSKSEDTPDQLAEDIRHYFAPKKVKSFTDTSDQDTIEVPSVKQRDSSQSEPTQDTSLTEITAEYFMATDPDRVALQRKVLAWHKAEIAKLFEQIRSEVIGEDKPDNSFDEDYINGWNNCLAEQREALTRIESK